MKVLHLIGSLGPGGAEQGLLAMAPALAARGLTLEVGYLRDRPGGLHAELAAAGIEVVSLGGDGGAAGWLARTAAHVRRSRPDLLHTSLTKANLVGRIVSLATRAPVVSSLVNEQYGIDQRSAPGADGRKTRLLQLADVATARRVVRFHAVTQWVADVMAPRLRVRPERIDVVPRGRDPDLLGRRSPERRARARQALGVGHDEPVVLAAARQDHQKGLDVLVEAIPTVLAQWPKVRFVVAGREGDQTSVLETTLGRLGVQDAVRFLGLRHDVPELISAADVFVLPSRWEGIGGVLLEAMALEAPIVTSDLPPLREVVGDDARALLVPAKQPEALGRAIAATLADPEAAAERATRARQRFLERFTVDRVADEMAAFYRRALTEATP